MTWQPIETAPKDGKRILLSSASGCMSVGEWSMDGWACGFHLLWFGPTHWMPLPPPPNKETA